MLSVDCQICKDSLGGDKHPVAMPCGHMYYLDCATFWFNSGDGKKCFCGKAFSGEQIIRLWTSDDEQPVETRSTRNREELIDAAGSGLADVNMDSIGDGSAVGTVLQRLCCRYATFLCQEY